MRPFGWLRRRSAAPLPQCSVVTFNPAGGDWVPTHQHRKGGLYRLLGLGTNEADRRVVAVYDDDTGHIWVRDAAEFNDGRFTPLADAGGKP